MSMDLTTIPSQLIKVMGIDLTSMSDLMILQSVLMVTIIPRFPISSMFGLLNSDVPEQIRPISQDSRMSEISDVISLMVTVLMVLTLYNALESGDILGHCAQNTLALITILLRSLMISLKVIPKKHL